MSSIENNDSSHALLIRTLENVATLGAKLDIFIGQMNAIQEWRQSVAVQQQKDALQFARIDRDLDELKNDVKEVKARPALLKERWHQYVAALLCGGGIFGLVFEMGRTFLHWG